MKILNKTLLGIVILFFLVILVENSLADTNISILHGYNGSEFVPLQVHADGSLKTTLNLSESVGLSPRDDNAYDLGTLTRRWQNLYVYNIIALGNLNVSSLNVSGSGNATFEHVLIKGTLHGGSPLTVAGGINITGVAAGDDAFFITNASGEKVFSISRLGSLNISSGAGNTSFDTNTLFVDAENDRVGIGVSFPNDALEVVGNVRISGSLNASSINVTGNLQTDTLNVTNVNSNATFQGDVKIIGSLHGGSPLKISGGINISGVPVGQDAFFVTNSSGGKVFSISNIGAINISSAAGNTSFDTNTLFIDSLNNRVGILNTAPASALDITGTVTATSFSGDGSSLTGFSNFQISNITDYLGSDLGNGSLIKVGNLSLIFSERNNSLWNVSSSDIFLRDNSGRVGIGTTNPSAKLEVNGTGPGNLLRIGNGTNDFFTINGSSGNVDLGATSGTLFVDSGNALVGIGQLSPNVTLGVSGDVNITGILYAGSLNVTRNVEANAFIGDGSALTGFSNFQISNITDYLGSDLGNGSLIKAGNLSLIFSERNNSLWNISGSDIFLKDNSGNVGIGTSTPLQTLVVVGTVNITDSLNVSGTVEANNFIGDGSGLTGISAGLSAGDHANFSSLNVTGDVNVTGGNISLSGPGTGIIFSDGTFQNTSGVPSGAVMFFNLASCPDDWSEFTSGRGLYLVGLPSGGTLAGTAGTALTDQENRAVGQHGGHVTGQQYSEISGNNNDIRGITSGSPSNEGSVAGTNAPYIQLLVCIKD